MTSLKNKIDFAGVIRVKNANPNGDPLNGNRPRTDYGGLGEITDVCLKRKLRDRLQENSHKTFVQSDDRKIDDAPSLRARAEAAGLVGAKPSQADGVAKATKESFDVRAFGQLFAYAGTKKGKKAKGDEAASSEGDAGVSIGIRGPVTIQSAFSVEPVSISSTQITKSVSGEGDGSKRASDTMGMKHRVDQGIYVTFGSMNPQLAERTGFSDEDAEVVKGLLPKLFENDASSARPDGSMEVLKVLGWKHNSKAGQYSSAKVHGSITVGPDGTIARKDLAGLEPQVIDGF